MEELLTTRFYYRSLFYQRLRISSPWHFTIILQNQSKGRKNETNSRLNRI